MLRDANEHNAHSHGNNKLCLARRGGVPQQGGTVAHDFAQLMVATANAAANAVTACGGERRGRGACAH